MDELKTKLHQYGITLKKKYGQNFLSDELLLEKIVSKSGVDKSVTVLEIGCGVGTLTKVLCKCAKNVLGYEIDSSLKPVLQDVLSDVDNVEIIFKDIMREKFETIENKLNNNYILVANLPYYITTPIVMRFLENSKKLVSMVIMVQEEVAERFCAVPATSEYGAITVGINLRGKAEIIEKIDRKQFLPIPNVDSAVVKITMDKDKFYGIDLEQVRNVVRVVFSNRRKTLVNNLCMGLKVSKTNAEQVVKKMGLSATVRGEELSAEQFIILTELIEKNGN